MAYQVLARKWRPQRFDDVVGQRAVTQTLRNAIDRERVAQAFVFAGPRGVGKTTTARILARALNCVEGPTADPCGECDACREVAEGRDIDVLEIDAATHTQVDNVREVIISGLSIAPVRDRHKIFIIDEVHQLSSSSFNALLKSVEEPPPHVVFIMATTLLDKIPDTILSRSQVFEFRAIGTAGIVEQLRGIVEAEGVAIDDAGLALIARTANGSMRDAQSALDQVIAFAGESIGAADVSAVLGLVGRDAVLDMAETVAAETADRVFDLTGRFVEAGYDLRSVCRELSRLVRDLMVLKVDSRRIADPEIAADAERERLQALVDRFSREDLMRGFDVLSRAELDIRAATQPRYHFEMAMLRWIHLRGLVPLTELLGGAGGSAPAPPASARTGRRPGQGGSPSRPGRPAARQAHSTTRPPGPPSSAAGGSGASAGSPGLPPGAAGGSGGAGPPPGAAGGAGASAGSPGLPAGAGGGSGGAGSSPGAAGGAGASAGSPGLPAGAGGGSGGAGSSPGAAAGSPSDSVATAPAPGSVAGLKERFLAELERHSKSFRGIVAGQARIEVDEERITFVFAPEQRTLAKQAERRRSWLEPLASQVAGRKMTVVVRRVEGPTPPGAAGEAEPGRGPRQPVLTAPPPAGPPGDLESSRPGSRVEPAAASGRRFSPPGSPVEAPPAGGRVSSPPESPVLSAPSASPPDGPAPPVGLGPSASLAPSVDPASVDPASPPFASQSAFLPSSEPTADPSPPLRSPVRSESRPPAGSRARPASPPPLGSPVRSESRPPAGSRAGPVTARPASPPPSREPEQPGDLFAQAMDDPAVQTMLDVFPAEIKKVEEM